MNEQKIKEVFSDEQFVKSLLEMDSVQEVQAALHEKGLDLSEEELNATREVMIKVAEAGATELPDEELEGVAGGLLPVAIPLAVLAGCFTATGAVAGVVESIRRWRW